ncbi:MAG: amidohydrolase, partial [Planctomycetes bacterium]|nr:amidohydrolase [Planctomycetota bacterium]
MGKMCVALAMLLSFCSAVPAQEKPLAFVGAKIILIDGANIEEGVLVVHQGRITAVGAAGAAIIPDDARQIDV